MDEPAQCCCIDYAVAANVVRCWQLRTWRTDIKKIFQPNLTEGFSVCTSGTKEENLVDVGKSRHTKMCRDQNCVATTGAFWPNVPTFGCRAQPSRSPPGLGGVRRRRPDVVGHLVLDVPGPVFEVGRVDIVVLNGVFVGLLAGGHHIVL